MKYHLPRSLKLRRAFAAIEAGRKTVDTTLNVHHSASKSELGYLLKDATRSILEALRDATLSARTGKIEITVYADDEKFDMGAFWPKADYLRSIILEITGLKHAELDIQFKQNRRTSKIEVSFSWREVLWAETTEGLLF